MWNALIKKDTFEDFSKKKCVIGIYWCEMNNDKDIKGQVDYYQMLVNELKMEKILPEEFVTDILIEKLSDS